ncbi:MAG: PPC domain-containing protein [Acidobacteriota bacterium]
MSRVSRAAVVAWFVSVAWGSTAWAQPPLPVGAPMSGKATREAPAEYAVTAKTAGVLVVAVQGDGDLALQVTDSDGQILPDGSVDRDLNGSQGTEMLSIVIPEPGAYKVRIRLQGGSSSSFQISGGLIAFPPFAQASTDPDRRPTQAKPAQIGQAIEDSLNSASGDHWDWFLLKAAQAGTLVVLTRPLGEPEVDLVLEVFTDGNFSQPAGRSDQDLQGNSANESVTVNVTAGQAVHVKVSANSGNVHAKYRLSSSLVP